MTPLALIEAAATGLWVYTALTFGQWIRHMLGQEPGSHVAAVAELLGHLVPAMIGLVVLVLIGALIGLPSVVAFIAILFPAGTAYGTHMALSDALEGHDRPRPRIIAALVIAAGIITFRQIL